MRERLIETYLVKAVQSVGGRAIKLTSSNNRGLPDRMCLFPGGVIVYVECKAPGKYLAPLQKIWAKTLTDLGFSCITIDSKAKVDALIRWYSKRRGNAGLDIQNRAGQ